MGDEQRAGLQDAAEGEAFEARLAALTEYRTLLERYRRHQSEPGDHDRRAELRALLERSGGVPHALVWNPRTGEE